MLDKAKMALRIMTDAFDSEIEMYINAAKIDMGIAGVVLPEELDSVVETAVITYVRMHFGSPSDYERLKKSYDEQKAQLTTATGYTNW